MRCMPIRKYMTMRPTAMPNLLAEALFLIESHRLFRAPFFGDFEAGQLSSRQIRAWAKQRHFSSTAFPRFLGALISNLADEETRASYVKQVYEEHGQLNSELVHSRQLRRFIYAIGVTEHELAAEEMLEETRSFVDAYFRLSRSTDVTKSMAAFALGSEPVIAMEMELCCKGLRHLALSSQDIVYFTDHAEHDYRHTYELLDSLLPYIGNSDAESSALDGMLEILEARAVFYDGISNLMGREAAKDPR